MKTTSEYFASVSDYVDEGMEVEEAFDFLASEEGVEQIKEEIEKFGVTVHNIEFLECDSGNWTHATAYYEVKAEGTREQLTEAFPWDFEE